MKFSSLSVVLKLTELCKTNDVGIVGGGGGREISQTFALFVSDFSRVKINRAPFPSDYEAELTKDFHLPELFTSSLKF